MNEIPAQAAMGWDTSRRSRHEPVRARLRDVLPPVAATLMLALANLAFGAVQPFAALLISAGLTAIAVTSLAAAGPRAITAGMMIGACVVALAALTGLAGPLYRSAPHLAVLFAAGAIWTIGYIAARRRSALDAAWNTLIWTSAAYCAWMFVAAASSAANQTGSFLGDAFDTPANASVLFGLLAVIGMARVLHVLKQVDADALAGLRIMERLLRDGLGGFLLLGLSLSCLLLAGSRPGILFTAGVLAGHLWWDTLAITLRPHRGLVTRFGVILAPILALLLAGLGIADGWLRDETIAPGIGLSEGLPNLQRFDAYSDAWLESPVFGHGLGSIDVEGAAMQTLQNAKVMLAPGGAHNVFLSWLVEGGLVGLAIMLVALTLAHVRIFSALISRRAPRTFPRMAFAASALLLLHGVTDSSLNLPATSWLYALLLGAACGLAPGGRKATATASEQEQE